MADMDGMSAMPVPFPSAVLFEEPRRAAAVDPRSAFHSATYQEINQRRLEHLATLGLDLAGTRVLEISGGVGDLTSFFLSRGAEVTLTDVREENLRVSRERFAARRDVRIERLDLNRLPTSPLGVFDVVFCYGVFYHLGDPTEAIAFAASCCKETMLVESCVTPGTGLALNPVLEDATCPSQAADGRGCRPTREWYIDRLSRHFPHVYSTVTQPSHLDFETDWSSPAHRLLYRSVFVASRSRVHSPALTRGLPLTQRAV